MRSSHPGRHDGVDGVAGNGVASSGTSIELVAVHTENITVSADRSTGRERTTCHKKFVELVRGSAGPILRLQ